jgi:hypothetical protein
MREDKWRKEDQARVNLLRNVYDNRAHHIDMKAKIRDETGWLLANEKQQLQ